MARKVVHIMHQRERGSGLQEVNTMVEVAWPPPDSRSDCREADAPLGAAQIAATLRFKNVQNIAT